MHDLLPRPTVEFKGGPYDKRIVVLDDDHTIAACTVFRLDPGDPEDGYLYWMDWGRVHVQMFVFRFDEEWS